MQIIQQDDRLVFISEDPTIREEDKVKSFNWTDIKTFSFNYPSENIWLKLRN